MLQIPMLAKVDSIVGEDLDVVVILTPRDPDFNLGDVSIKAFERRGYPVATSSDEPGISLARALWLKPATRIGRKVFIAKIRHRKNRAGELMFDAARFGKIDWSLSIDPLTGVLLNINETAWAFSRKP
jgi:hypothetical protein